MQAHNIELVYNLLLEVAYEHLLSSIYSQIGKHDLDLTL